MTNRQIFFCDETGDFDLADVAVGYYPDVKRDKVKITIDNGEYADQWFTMEEFKEFVNACQRIIEKAEAPR